MHVQPVTSAAGELAEPTINRITSCEVTVKPIHCNSQSLDRANVGALHDDLCLFVFCLPSGAEPAANSCFHEQEKACSQLVEISEV